MGACGRSGSPGPALLPAQVGLCVPVSVGTDKHLGLLALCSPRSPTQQGLKGAKADSWPPRVPGRTQDEPKREPLPRPPEAN